MIRHDVKNLAERLNIKSGLSTASVYAFLVSVGKAKKTNPCKLDWTAGNGIVFLTGGRDCYCLQCCTTSGPRTYDGGAGDYWHDRIMDRQSLDA